MSSSLPLVHAEDIRIGTYLADPVRKRLFAVVDIRTAERHGRPVRLAILEDARTEEIEPYEFGALAGLRVVTRG